MFRIEHSSYLIDFYERRGRFKEAFIAKQNPSIKFWLITPDVKCDVCGHVFFHVEPWCGYLGEIKCMECGGGCHFVSDNL